MMDRKAPKQHKPAGKREAQPARNGSRGSRMKRNKERLIVVSNRLPYVFARTAEGGWKTEGGSGGLVSALVPVLRDRGGTGIGWPGTSGDGTGLDDALLSASRQLGFNLRGVQLD